MAVVQQSPLLSEAAIKRAHDRAAEAPKWETPEVLAVFLAAQDREALALAVEDAVVRGGCMDESAASVARAAVAALLGPVS